MAPTLLDTDTLSEVLKQKDQRVRSRVADYLGQHAALTISAFTWFEVQRGLLEKHASRQIDRFATFVNHCDVKPVSHEVFHRAAVLWADARRSGRPRGDADLLIAATAMAHGLTLATSNTRHFEWISGLSLDDWRAT
ncbi:tRNA(fMet)-specific endonuclease VapC [Pirellulimonas nuda]|uniref:Ribonuclease VapC n=1 Tax=Pirellulimonas nuda TaxID=2528009 RepID=A0A518D9U4_9BACT|nr:type II toxin-antitoxin system VapC family toxin [Pirellulimonas nuda]QDU88206.1 tRNA(fMet)-specific endonuclease VapC [Pirellulimonas nuda]